MSSQETTILRAVIITSVFIAALIISFFSSLLRKHKHNLYLQKQNGIAEISAMEKERSRIATDLHDEITSALMVAKMKLALLAVQDSTEENKKKELVKNIDEIAKRLREISFDLMPTALLNNGLVSGIHALVRSITDAYNIDIKFIPQAQPALATQKAINIFRVVQEILHNAIKHAEAGMIVIMMEIKENRLIVSIADDGIGFNYNEKLKKDTGFGLRSIRNRVEIMNGHLFVDSTTGHGASYVFKIPLN